jgi:ERCC4-related helicase
LPAYNVAILDGEDAERWSDQSTWDAVLNNMRVVVSTHQVLLDALTHAFVKMFDLALLIFDEGNGVAPSHK